MNQPIDSVSKNLKTVRESRKLSLDGLSELTGVSKSMLRQIETGKSSPTIATIWKIANGLKMSFTSLLRKPAVKAEVKPFRTGEPLTAENAHYRLFPLIPFDPEQSFETYFIEMDPDTVFSGEPHEGHTYEYLFVIKGRLEIRIDGERFEINENQFLQFQADRPHEYRCLSRETASAIMQISYLS
ncbi:MAG: XRE family transcriptional regulator [Desulfovibrionales bacterium]|nr:XRE family transcriptional regulator [Desulfovibrionales bacterium]